MEKGFTLVIPLYNKVKVFRNTLDSVLNNHGEYPFKCIIVDDDSTDGSSEIGEEYNVKYPDVFMYIKKKHRGQPGPSFARNLGIKLAETEYIGFLDCDDELCAGFIDRACTFLDEHPEYSMYSNGHIDRTIDEDGNATLFDVRYSINNINNIIDLVQAIGNNGKQVHFSGSVYKTDLANQIMFNDVYGEDMDFVLRYYYYNPSIYIDNSTSQTIIHNVSYSDSSKWYSTRKYPNTPFFEILKTLENEIPDFPYTFWIDDHTVDNNIVHYQIIK